MRLLLVEDSSRLRQSVSNSLSRLGHGVDVAADGEEAELLVSDHEYDAIILDLMLPERSGLDCLASWRGRGLDVPVIILTALGEVEDRVRGFALGADDYLAKPFAFEELVARLGAVVRRARGKSGTILTIGDIEIDFAARMVQRCGKEIVLTAREFTLLECLARRPGQIFSREQIEAHLYSERESPVSNAVDVAIHSLRKKICPEGTRALIQTRRGLGYYLEAK